MPGCRFKAWACARASYTRAVTSDVQCPGERAVAVVTVMYGDKRKPGSCRDGKTNRPIRIEISAVTLRVILH